jgi:hypothetical protein
MSVWMAALNDRRVGEVLAQVRNVFEEDRLVVERDPEEQHQVLVHLSHVADVRCHR